MTKKKIEALSKVSQTITSNMYLGDNESRK